MYARQQLPLLHRQRRRRLPQRACLAQEERSCIDATTNNSPARCDLLVFRESAGRHRRRTSSVLADISAALDARLDNALVLSSEIECALEDAQHPSAFLAGALTDSIARRFSNEQETVGLAMDLLKYADLPMELLLNTPEGCSFYSLGLREYAAAVRALAHGKKAGIIGIRSAGIALSAICLANGDSRITVRPTGHPYDRELVLTSEQLDWIAKAIGNDSEFFIVDEGPGLSGSSFLAAAEAVEGAGVSRARIHLLGNNQCAPERLVSRDAVNRWRRFDFHAMSQARMPDGLRRLKHGDWRAEFLSDQDWPPAWGQLSPAAYLSETGDAVWKYEGLGTHGELAFSRVKALAHAGFLPELQGRSGGLIGYAFASGRLMSSSQLDQEVISEIARYLAFRKSSFTAEPVDENELTRAVKHNVRELIGVELNAFELPTVYPVVCDSRMQPFEWLRSQDKFYKLDSVAHGDNHFFPGPCDIAWDVAAAIHEWRMDRGSADLFVDVYKRTSRDHTIDSRLPFYQLAYATQQLAFARMAGHSLRGEAERERFAKDELRYSKLLREAIAGLAREQSVTA